MVAELFMTQLGSATVVNVAVVPPPPVRTLPKVSASPSPSSISRTLDGNAPISVNPDTLQLVDEYNREVYFHGVNVVVKSFPWVPDTTHFDPLTSFNEKDMATLQDLGLNGIRLGTMWPGVEPTTRGVYNYSYLNVLHGIVKKAAEYDIYSLLDMHQDVWSEKFCGEGVPMWAAVPNNGSNFPWPASNVPYNTSTPNGIPSVEDCASKPWAGYYFTEATGSAFQNFYDNVDGLRDAWVGFWQQVAIHLGGPLGGAVLGYELMNEPWAGNAVSDLLLMIPGVADKVNLQKTWDAAADGIRKIDTSHAIFFEGVTWDWFNVGFTDIPGGKQWSNKSVLSYHFYKPPDFDAQTQLSARQDDMKRLRCGGFLTELFPDASLFNDCDQYLQSWLMWEYKPFFGNKTGSDSYVWFANGTMNIQHASLLSRTYAQVVAGKTIKMQFNPTSRVFVLMYDVSPAVHHNTTKIYFNEALHYPSGFSANASSSVPSISPSWRHVSKNHIEVYHTMGTTGTVVFELSPQK